MDVIPAAAQQVWCLRGELLNPRFASMTLLITLSLSYATTRSTKVRILNLSFPH
ncbi:hypothetical protein E2C01_077251 [Portunus trituberculatus]|uniref:Uncharacterized protein n=1 Tax=Portunus trituberculatus TaxID=210409 RepID=A0A5B7ILN8_PORTR|nr:hypothetical protein [Portunus trituberculatus]